MCYHDICNTFYIPNQIEKSQVILKMERNLKKRIVNGNKFRYRKTIFSNLYEKLKFPTRDCTRGALYCAR